ncbi:MAG: hypothetical protein M3Z09_04450 [Acidobacteriota bacterium]|nr:hypothetical protein [Acidobacteriota bacterium]
MKTTFSLLFVTAATFSGNAAIIPFASNATFIDNTQGNSIGNNVVIQKHPVWANPLPGSRWISFADTGDPSSAAFGAPANGAVVSFFQHFTLSAADISAGGYISFFADDSAASLLNGHLLVNEASISGNTYNACSDTKPNCIVATNLAIPSQDLVLGVNTLQFNVAQRAGSSFGLDYYGYVGAPSSLASTPEPATWSFVAGGALLMGIISRWRSTVGARS